MLCNPWHQRRAKFSCQSMMLDSFLGPNLDQHSQSGRWLVAAEDGFEGLGILTA